MTEFTGEVHWYAAAFPLLTEDELATLADDIRERGLQHPIVLSPDGVLLDGRNRLAACELANVEPTFAVTHQNPVQFITGENAHRRHLTAGQRAMAVAVGMFEAGLWLEDKGSWKRGSLKDSKVADATLAVTDLKLSGQILAHDRTLALNVLSGDRNLREAYDQVQEAKRREAEQARRLQELHEHAPDLLEQASPEFTVAMAYAAYQERDKERIREEREAAELLQKHSQSLGFAICRLEEYVLSDDNLTLLDDALLDAHSGYEITRERCERAIQTVDELMKRKGL